MKLKIERYCTKDGKIERSDITSIVFVRLSDAEHFIRKKFEREDNLIKVGYPSKNAVIEQGVIAAVHIISRKDQTIQDILAVYDMEKRNADIR